MPVELEAKMKVADFEPIRRILRASGAIEAGDHFEVNTYFDTPDHSLLSRDSGLRIRTTLTRSHHSARHVMTFKGPRETSAVKARREIEFEIGDAPLATELLEALGYVVQLSFEKRRQVWSLRQCEVVLDELPLLGAFVEIEGPDDRLIQGVRELLGLADAPLIGDSYASMLAAYCRDHGLTDRSIRF